MRYDLPFTLEQVKEWRGITPTPFYVYDENGIRETVNAIHEAFAWEPGYCEYFAVKACPTPAVLRVLADMGCGADCASVSEIMLAEASGMTGDKIIFSSNETLPEEYRAAVAAGAAINLDDITQIAHLEATAGIPDTVCCRYNPGEFAISNQIIGNLHDSKFGMTREQIFEAYRILKEKGVRHFGIHAMLASCSLEESYYPRLARELFSLVVELKEELGIEMEFIDMSGGIGIPYRPEEKAVDIRRIGEGVHEVYDEILVANGIRPSIRTEMGRFVTGPHGYLVTSVTGMKHTYKEYIGVDASMCDLMRPAMYGAYHHITVLGKENEEPSVTVDVVGALCENNDKFAIDRELPALEEGDLLVIQDAGAHGHSMGFNYNGRMRCAELLMRPDGTADLVRRSETPADLFATLDVDEEFTGRCRL